MNLNSDQEVVKPLKEWSECNNKLPGVNNGGKWYSENSVLEYAKTIRVYQLQ